MHLSYISFLISVIFANILPASCYGKGSLTFVIDNTPSMADAINYVKEMTKSIADIVFDEKDSQIGNMVLVTFNDPYTQLETVTTDRKVFKSKINELNVHNNYSNNDCAEMSMSGLSLALEKSLPGSFIYVFSDASAKDYMKSSDVIKMCQDKQTQVVFIMKGYCRQDLGKAPFQVYYDVAAACSGSVVYIYEHEIPAMYEPIKDAIIDKKTFMISRVIPAYKDQNISFVIREQNENTTVTASGTNLYMSVQGPGQSLLEQVHQQRLTWLQNMKVLKLTHLVPGTYTLSIRSSSLSTVYVAAKSDFSFRLGFSKLKDMSPKGLLPQPISNTSTRLFITISDPQNAIHLTSVQFLYMDEQIMETYDLALIRITNMFYFYETPSFIAPSQIFKVAVLGIEISNGENIRSISQFPVTPQLEEIPQAVTKNSSALFKSIDVTTNPKTSHPIGDLLALNITWPTLNDTKIPNEKYFIENGAYVIKNLTLNDTAVYKYEATNLTALVRVSMQAVIFLPQTHFKNVDVTTTPKAPRTTITDLLASNITWPTTNQTVTPIPQTHFKNDDVTTTPKAPSTTTDLLASNITWPMANQTVTPMKPSITTNISLIYKSIEENTSLRIPCNAIGFPKPIVTWTVRNQTILPNEKYSIEDGALVIKNPSLNDTAVYKCEATNSVGSVSVSIQAVVVQGKPNVIISEGTSMEKEQGESFNLTCKVTAYPEPKILWFNRHGKILKSQYSMEKSPNGFKSVLRILKIWHNQTIFCFAHNKHGFQEAPIRVIIKNQLGVTETIREEKPIVNITEGTEMEIERGKSLNLTCKVMSYTKPRIVWSSSRGEALQSQITSGELPNEYISYFTTPELSKDATFFCIVHNKAGFNNASFRVIVKVETEVKTTPKDK